MTLLAIRYEERFLRVLALIAAGILLNFGVFFILSILSPLVIGIVSGFFFTRYRAGGLVGSASAIVSYTIIFVTTSLMIMDMFSILLAVLIMTILGLIGGLLGVFLHLKFSE